MLSTQEGNPWDKKKQGIRKGEVVPYEPVAPEKTQRPTGKNPGSYFPPDAHRTKNPVSRNWIVY